MSSNVLDGRTAAGPRRRPVFHDYVARWLLRLAKLQRRSFDAQASNSSEEFYEEFFEDRDVEAYDEDPRMVQRRSTIVKILEREASSARRVLDVGCGLGDILRGVPGNYLRHGVDYAQSNVAVARRRLGDQADIRVGSVYDLPYSDDSFDVCLCLEVIEHLEDDGAALKQISRVLKRGGLLIAAVPYTYYWPEYLRLIGHYRHYTRESFVRLLQHGGFRVEQFLPNCPQWHQSFTRHYAMLRAAATVFGGLRGETSPYAFQWPWAKEPALRQLESKLEPLRQKDLALDYENLETSTFILARNSNDVKN